MGFERAADVQDLAPVLDRLLLVELGGLGHVPAAPDDDRVAALDVRPLEIGVRDLAGVDANAVAGLLRPSLLAHGAALTALQRVELRRPVHCSDVTIGASVPETPKSCTSASRTRCGCRPSKSGRRSPSTGRCGRGRSTLPPDVTRPGRAKAASTAGAAPPPMTSTCGPTSAGACTPSGPRAFPPSSCSSRASTSPSRAT